MGNMLRLEQAAAITPSADRLDTTGSLRIILIWLQAGLVISICGAVFGRDVFRLADAQSGFGVELLHRVVRGLLFLSGKYLAYPLAFAVALLIHWRSGKFSLAKYLRATWRFWLFLAYLAVAAGVSSFPEAVL